MDVGSIQAEMNAAYVRGAPGVAVSGIVWLIAGVLARQVGFGTGIGALFIGGMLIYPLSLLIARLLFKAPAVAPANPFNRLAMEGTVMLFVGVLIAYRLLPVAPALAFPVMALAIGARYLHFQTLYGQPLYWALGGILLALGCVALLGIGGLGTGGLGTCLPLLVGGVELAFATMLFLRRA